MAKVTKVPMVVEIPQGSKIKYELKNGVLTIDRIVPFPYPFSYGFIPNTMAPDGDALDAFLVGVKTYSPGQKTKGTVVGMVNFLDAGEEDNKLILLEENLTIDKSILVGAIDSIAHFLKIYKGNTIVTGINYKPANGNRLLAKSRVK